MKNPDAPAVKREAEEEWGTRRTNFHDRAARYQGSMMTYAAPVRRQPMATPLILKHASASRSSSHLALVQPMA
jgi:hypothetical protein